MCSDYVNREKAAFTIDMNVRRESLVDEQKYFNVYANPIMI